MRGLLKHVVTEPGAETAPEFAFRVRMLAVTYAVLFCSSTAAFVVLAVHGKLFVTLAQRSNVETLLILFLLVFYGYLAALSAPGALGALRIALGAAQRGFTRDREATRRRQIDALRGPVEGPFAGLAAVLERDDGESLRFALGAHGAIEVDGARVSQREARGGGSADLLAYFVHQVREVSGRDMTIVEWGQIDEEDTERYLAQVEFARRLRAHLRSAPLWPTVTLTAEQCDEIGRRLLAIEPALLEDALLPDWEYAAEHKLPVIPEPLALVTLGRSAKRADPVATMGFATAMVLITLAVIVLFVLDKPWVPG